MAASTSQLPPLEQLQRQSSAMKQGLSFKGDLPSVDETRAKKHVGARLCPPPCAPRARARSVRRVNEGAAHRAMYDCAAATQSARPHLRARRRRSAPHPRGRAAHGGGAAQADGGG